MNVMKIIKIMWSFSMTGIIVDNFMVDIGGKLEGNIGEFIS